MPDNKASAPLKELSQVAMTRIGGMQLAIIDRAQSAILMVREAKKRKAKGRGPAIVSSANGQVLSEYAANSRLRALFEKIDIVHADGMPLVVASRFFGSHKLPERVATTDLFHDVAKISITENTSFYMLGADQKSLNAAVENVRKLYPGLNLCGARNGYFSQEEEDGVIAEINRVKPDILWVAMGVPREQEFCIRNREKLTNVGLIKTSGGLFDFLSGGRSRAPQWMQTLCLEWFYRMCLEPRRLFWRYLTTNIRSFFLILVKSH